MCRKMGKSILTHFLFAIKINVLIGLTFIIQKVMKKIIFIFFACGLATLTYSQQIVVQSVKQVNGPEMKTKFYPQFTPDGTSLLLTSENYQGLDSYDLATKELKTLTSDPGAGYQPVVSADSKTICFRKNSFVDNRKFTSFYSLDVETKQATQLTQPERGAALKRPQNLLRSGSAPVMTVYIENQKIVLEKSGKKTVLTPNGKDQSYIWPQISPDQKKLTYTVAGKGTFVCDISGKNVVSLGKLGAPQWLNNNWVIGMDDRDDGHILLSSDIIAVSVNGKVRQNLTQTSDRIEMYPAASPAGDKIVFNTDKGDLYMMEISFK